MTSAPSSSPPAVSSLTETDQPTSAAQPIPADGPKLSQAAEDAAPALPARTDKYRRRAAATPAPEEHPNWWADQAYNKFQSSQASYAAVMAVAEPLRKAKYDEIVALGGVIPEPTKAAEPGGLIVKARAA